VRRGGVMSGGAGVGYGGAGHHGSIAAKRGEWEEKGFDNLSPFAEKIAITQRYSEAIEKWDTPWDTNTLRNGPNEGGKGPS